MNNVVYYKWGSDLEKGRVTGLWFIEAGRMFIQIKTGWFSKTWVDDCVIVIMNGERANES